MPSSRGFIAGLIRLALVVLAIVFISGYVKRRFSSHPSHVRVTTKDMPPMDSLGPGDVRILDADSAVDLTLVGDKILAGLSPKTIAQVKGELDKSADGDTTGIGGSISQIVKRSVAGAIGTHAVFPLSDIKDIHYVNEQIVIDWTDGGTHELFGNTKVNGSKGSKSFRREDAMRFVDAVRARKGLPPTPPS